MRSSDWSSDVCASDLRSDVAVKLVGDDLDQVLALGGRIEDVVANIPGASDVKLEQVTGLPVLSIHPDRERSEEHTSELQSLMRISYAVFCLKKKHHKITSHY